MELPYTCILFDLDGTIIDSAPGITATIGYTLEQLGMPVPSPSALLNYVGPPLLDSFAHLAGMTQNQCMQALAIYREQYLAHGVLDATVYPGVFELIRNLHEAGLPLSLATSKPESLARIALTHLGVMPYLDLLTGASEDEKRSAKADVVELALARLAAFGADISRPVLIGDRHFDIEGAAVHSVPTIMVEWGYGAIEEYENAVAVVANPSELRALLLGPVAGIAEGN